MKKHLFALFCAFAILLGAVPAAALEGESLRTADQLSTLNLVQGNGTDYALDTPVSRAQAAVLLVRLSGTQSYEIKDFWASGFRDLPGWCVNEVSYASLQHWVQGVSMTEFRPNSTVTANAWFTMLLQLLGYSDATGDFTVHNAPLFAQRIGLVSRGRSGTMTRGDVFESIRSALTFSYKDVIERLIQKGACSRTTANALGLGLAISSGIVSNPARQTDGYTLPCVMNTADISRGSSGGALLNESGDVIAVTSGAYTYGNNMYLAVPVDPILSVDLTASGRTLAEMTPSEAAKTP